MPAMPEPSSQAIEPERLARLRSRAASSLAGTAATKGDVASAADALSVLHALASSPETAADALTLLHELQVYQVELELQAQELRESRTELESALRRQIELYDYQPVGCFTIDTQSIIHELNRTGAEMLGIGRDDASGLPLETFFCAESAGRFRAVVSRLAGLHADKQPGCCIVRLRPKDGAGGKALARIGRDLAPHRYLVSLTAFADDQVLPGDSQA